ncbi:MAG: acyl carrier protein [Eubacteriaceae bacterium]|jgi:acyl carrier protein|nr:acyl carrier protein [Eubacteriaceae bacterium]
MVYEKVVEILKQHSSMEGLDVTRETTFQDAGIDSLDFVEILMEIEEALGVELELEENFANVGELVDFVSSKVK